MKAKHTNIIGRITILRIALVTAVVLLVPFLAMQFNDDVKWDETDFLIIGVLVFSTGLMYELITKKIDKKYRFLLGAGLVAVLLLIWAELGVGIFGTPFAGN